MTFNAPASSLSHNGNGYFAGHRIVTETAQLHELARWPSVIMKSTSVAIKLPGIDDETARLMESQINQHLTACGCTEGAVFLMIGIGGYVVYVSAFFPSDIPLSWSTLWIGLSVAFAAAVVGKLAGLIRHQVLLAGIIRKWLVKNN